MGLTLGILVVLFIMGYCVWRRLVQRQKRRGLAQSVAMSKLSRLPVLDRSIAERTWAMPATMCGHPTAPQKEDPPTYTTIDMLRDLSQGV